MAFAVKPAIKRDLSLDKREHLADARSLLGLEKGIVLLFRLLPEAKLFQKSSQVASLESGSSRCLRTISTCFVDQLLEISASHPLDERFFLFSVGPIDVDEELESIVQLVCLRPLVPTKFSHSTVGKDGVFQFSNISRKSALF